ncbi:uncharacterized protein [Palaemon carinicauda]|uniref:uncharacterized protein n=1 Tax=Palaemon carinicauda TaxID=392227 RepID=UPI0035B69300
MAEKLLHKQSNSYETETELFRRHTASKLHLEEARVVNRDTGLDNKSPRCYEWKYHLQVWRLPERPPMSLVEEARAGIRGMTIDPSRNKVDPIMFRGKLPTPEHSPHGHRFEHFVQPNNEKKDFTKANIACGLTLLEKENFVSKEEKKEMGETSPSNVTSNKDYASIDNCNDSGYSRVTIDNRKEVEEKPMENSKSSDRTGKVTCQKAGETQKRAENHQSLGLDQGYQGGALADERLGYDNDDKRDDSLSNDAGSEEDPGVFQEVNGSIEFVDDEGHFESEYYEEENNENDWYPGYYKVYQETTPNTYDQETLYWYDDEYESNSEYDDLDQYYYRPEYYNDKEVYDEIENFDRTDGHHGYKNYADSVFYDANGYEEP